MISRYVLAAVVLGIVGCKQPSGSSAAATATATATAAVPAGWPSWAPPYPGSTVLEARSDANGKFMSAETSDSRDKVVDFYEKEFAAAGFTVGATASLGTGAGAAQVVTMSKDPDMCSLTVTPSGATTKIAMTLTDH